jgi:hypothetical protein
MALSTITFGKLAQSEDINPIIRLLQGTAGTEQAVSLVTNTHATNPSLTLRAQHATGTSFKIRNHDDTVDVVKVYRNSSVGVINETIGNVFQLANGSRFGIGTGVSDDGNFYMDNASSRQNYSMARFVYDTTSTTANSDVGAGIFLLRTLSGGTDAYTRALELHNLKGTGTTSLPQLGLELSVESVIVGNGVDRLVGIQIKSQPTIWGLDPTFGTGRRCDSAILIGNDEVGWTNAILYQDTTGAGGGTLFVVNQNGQVASKGFFPTADSSFDLGTALVAFRAAYVDTLALISGGSAPAIGMYAPAANSFAMTTNTTTRLSADANGNVIVGAGILTTTATDGYLYIPASAGAPTGVPTSVSGRVPIHYDATNNRFYVYDAGWVSVALV